MRDLRRPALAAAFAVLPLVATADDGPGLPDLAAEAYRLPNGLKVALHRDPSVPRVTVCVAYRVGSKDERAGRTGFAHFFEHMMFRGTANVPNYDIPLQEAGAQSNAFTSEDMTVYFETVPAHWLDRALYLEAERLAFLSSALDREKFDTEREVVKNERRQSMDNIPYGRAPEILQANLFPPGHPYSWSVIGSMEDLNHANLDDLRRFFAEFYHPGNATLCLVGDFDPAAAKGRIARHFGGIPAGPEPRRPVAPPSPPVDRRIAAADAVKLPRIYWAWPTVADDHQDAPALDLLASILAGGQASRLYRALVLDARLATDVSADSDTREIAGLFTVDATADEGRPVADIEAKIRAEIDRLRAEPPTAAELARSLAKLEKGLYSRLTQPLGRAVTLAIGFAQKGDPHYFRKDFARYFEVTPADVSRVAKTYLGPEKLALVVGPRKEGVPEDPPVQAGPRPTDEPPVDIKPRSVAGDLDWSKLPGPSRPLGFEPPKVVRRTLRNGLDVRVVPWKVLPVVEARLLLPFGTADDPAGKGGLGTLVTTLLDQGTKDQTAVEFAEGLETLGASLNVEAGVDTTSLSISTLARTLSPTLEKVGALLASPRFDPKDFDRERDLQVTGLLQGPDDIQWITARAFRSLLYGPEHPYGLPATGTTRSVKALTLDDVRDVHKARVVPDGSSLVVVGDVDPDALIATLEGTLGDWKGKAPSPSPRPDPPAKVEPGVVFLVDKSGAVQSTISVGRVGPGRDDPRYFAALLGNRVLGGDFLSRLNQNLREKNGFTYGAGSGFHFRRKGGVWQVRTSVRADATAPALREVLAELNALSGDRPLSNEEVVVAQDSELQSFPETFESPEKIAGAVREVAEFGLADDYLATVLDGLNAVTPEAAREALTRVVAPSARVVLVVGDRKAIEADLRAIPGVREVRVLPTPGP